MNNRGKKTKRQLLASARTLFVSMLAANAGIIKAVAKKLQTQHIIRPPGALQEKKFIQRCIRCGNCLKICPTNVLQPLSADSTVSSFWTPYLDNTIGYCEYDCNLCSQVCPTDAIKKITKQKKKKLKIGLAEINRQTCLPWSSNTNCIVCEEHCPISTKAIKIEEVKQKDGTALLLPHVDKDLCIGCGICENKCPTRPQRSINVINIQK